MTEFRSKQVTLIGRTFHLFLSNIYFWSLIWLVFFERFLDVVSLKKHLFFQLCYKSSIAHGLLNACLFCIFGLGKWWIGISFDCLMVILFGDSLNVRGVSRIPTNYTLVKIFPFQVFGGALNTNLKLPKIMLYILS